eukprot:6276491-Amphidinium_carterae.1
MKTRQDPKGHPTGAEIGREASRREDPSGHSKDPWWTPFGGGVFFHSFPGPFAALGVVEIISVFCKVLLLPGRAHLQDGPGLAWIGGTSSCYLSWSSCSCLYDMVIYPLPLSHQGGMPTKVVPVQQQPEPLSEDERFEFQGLWIALKRAKMRVHWSLNSPVDATLPPGAMARVIGPTRLVAPAQTTNQHLPRAKNIVRAYVELAAPWRRGNCGDFGY